MAPSLSVISKHGTQLSSDIIKEAERFEEDLDSTEYHDATEELTRKEESEEPQLPLKPGASQGVLVAHHWRSALGC